MFEKTLSPMLGLLPAIEAALTKPYRIAIKAQGRILFIDPADIAQL
jgi:hypothetical protein